MNDKELILAGMDVKSYLDRVMNNTALAKMLIGKFLQDQNMNQLRAAVAAQDWKAAEFACHALKGVTGNLSLTRLFALTHEQLCLFRAGAKEEAAAMLAEIDEAYETAVSHLNLWLAEQ